MADAQTPEAAEAKAPKASKAQSSKANAPEGYEPRMKSIYRERIRAVMKEKFGYTNEMQIPKLDKIVVNMGGSARRWPIPRRPAWP